ncbi:MAG TPA: tryptophanase [Candidatus Limiplasma sp.]|nr:tryptophanase [Candidatus Limiplasma sp.]HRX09359.1 tryptophanase [Candidatus Limiplasma sp.]
MDYIAEPFKIKAVEPLKVLTRSEREQKIKAAGYNLFSVRAEDVYIDLMTDSGTGAMSQHQWAAIMTGDEAYAGAQSYYRLMDACQEIFGYAYFQPVHQGRAAEKVFMPIMLADGKVAVSNTFFDTTRAHVELAGATALDCAVPEAADTDSFYPFKGNMDLELLEKAIAQYGADRIGMIVMTVTNNSAGGQPVSMQNIRQTAAVAKKHHIPFVIDAARYAENAYFIQTREPGYADKSIIAIAREMFSCADAFLMSAKKDGIVNMGGLIGVKEDELLIRAVKERVIPYEGFITYGGLAGRDLDALAVGLLEATDESYLRYRIGQAEYLGETLRAAGVPIQYPTGGHAVFVDAGKMLPHIPYDQFPGHALAVALYEEAGIRSCEIGSYMLGRDPKTGEQLKSMFEFTRLAIPRRVYTQAHLDVVARALIAINARRDTLPGYTITDEPPVLRHFTAKLEPIR